MTSVAVYSLVIEATGKRVSSATRARVSTLARPALTTMISSPRQTPRTAPGAPTSWSSVSRRSCHPLGSRPRSVLVPERPGVLGLIISFPTSSRQAGEEPDPRGPPAGLASVDRTKRGAASRHPAQAAGVSELPRRLPRGQPLGRAGDLGQPVRQWRDADARPARHGQVAVLQHERLGDVLGVVAGRP